MDLLSPQARKLWAAYQGASSTLGESLRDLGFVDLVVYGRQTTGKSSLLGALCGVQLPTGENQITKCPIRITVNPNQQGATLTAAGGRWLCVCIRQMLQHAIGHCKVLITQQHAVDYVESHIAANH